MKYIFHLGRIPELSLAEIQAIVENLNIAYSVDFVSSKMLIVETKKDIDIENMFPKMGGTIKISRVLSEEKNISRVFDKISSIIAESGKKMTGKKILGYSIYFTQNEGKNKAFEISGQIRKNFIATKRNLSGKTGIRIIFPNANGELKSASVINNKILKKGWEFNFIFKTSPSLLTYQVRDKLLSGKRLIYTPDKKDWIVVLSETIVVQNINSYSFRDYGRPNREARIGMIPPKLAQIMINLAKISEGRMILDPFCGTGTILQEALLGGYKTTGIDANGKQIENCWKNLRWLFENFSVKHPDCKLFQADIGNIVKKIKPDSIDAIVTEPTLGPVYKKVPEMAEIQYNFRNLEKLYLRFFQNGKNVLRKKARLVLAFPAYKINENKYVFISFIDKLEKIGYSVIGSLDKAFIIEGIKTTGRSSIIYDRPDQIVAREVVVFENR